MTLIHVHRGAAEYQVLRSSRSTLLGEAISCRSPEELWAVLIMLGVDEPGLDQISDQLEMSEDAEVRV
jgi:hypothetical protein